jgi:hypothetical protein
MSDSVAGAFLEQEATVEEVVQLPQEEIKVIVIDDELAGLTSFHLQQMVHNFEGVLGDCTSPEFEELWSLTEELGGLPDAQDYDEEAQRKHLLSDNFVSSVVLNPQFENKVSDTVKALLTPFLDRAKKVEGLRDAIKTAFDGQGSSLEFSPNRPTRPQDLLKYDLIIFDLVLQDSTAPVDELVRYLKSLGEEQPSHLPSIIVMSSREELIQERKRFSTESNISAAGLMLLPKSEVFKANFGAHGIKLSYQQLKRQREIAQHMRVFMSAWTRAQTEAQEKARFTLWNLDAAAMQEIHLSASLDSDPYDGHLSEFLAKEYLWHVEGAVDVANAIDKLDECFTQQLKQNGNVTAIATRFMAPFVNPSINRDLVSHFTWSGFSLDKNILTKTHDEILADFSHALPFGAVLAPEEVGDDSDFLVHITQQCDILSVARAKKEGFTAKFAVARAIEVSDNRVPVHDNDEVVAKGLKLGDKEYDLKIVNGNILALPAEMLTTYIKEKSFNVVGRLRHEIATQFLVATANYMTRPAGIKTTRAQVHAVNLYLYGKAFGDLVSFTDDNGVALKLYVTKRNASYYFSDESSMRIALWVKSQVDQHYGKDIDLQKACDSLSVGVSNNACVSGVVSLVFKDQVFDARQRGEQFPAKNEKLGERVQLLALCV